jgi:hypothetical protein
MMLTVLNLLRLAGCQPISAGLQVVMCARTVKPTREDQLSKG